MNNWLGKTLSTVIAGVLIWLLTQVLLPNTPVYLGIGIGITVLVIGAFLYWFFGRPFPILEVFITSFDKPRKTISGRVVLKSNKPYWILIFAGKAGGPYWLQGAGGSLFTRTDLKQVGAQWEATWVVPEIHIGPNVIDVRAVAILPDDKKKFIEAGTPDSKTGNTFKINSLDELPKPKKRKISPLFDPTN